MDNETKEILSLDNIRKILMKGFYEKLCRRKITIEGVFNNIGNKMLLYDDIGNSIGLYFSGKLKEKTYIFPVDGDIITIEGYLNFGYQGETNTIENGVLNFWFNIEKILEIKESKSSKLQKLKNLISRKEKRATELSDNIKNLLQAGKKAKIIMLCSQTAEEDIKSGLAEESEYYDIIYKNVPLSKDSDSEKLNLAILEVINEGYDIIGFSRGGNDNYDIFYNEKIMEKIVYAKEFTLAGIGHSNLTCEFLDAFDYVVKTPMALGVFLRDLSLEVKKKKKESNLRRELKIAQKQKEKTYIVIIAIIVILALLLFFLF